MIGCIISILLSVAAFVISIFSFMERGFLFNNAYIWVSKKERDTMDKKPHYRQTAIVFLLIGLSFLTTALYALFEINWIIYAEILLWAVTIIYAVISSIKIDR